ncbi:MAG: DUF1501 domain-containing protein [bacterium]|nr:DUF1501 domain-containing protein [bacterium]
MIDRRDLLRGALFGAGMSAFPKAVMASAARALDMGPVNGSEKLLFIFQRGGNDGVNTLIPDGDGTYGQVRSNELFIQNGLSLNGVNYSRLNPNLDRLVDIFNGDDLALIHRVGDPSMSRSHFKAMDMFEKAPEVDATQSEIAALSGFVPRMMTEAGVPYLGANNLPGAVSISPLMQAMFLAGSSSQVSAHVRDLTLTFTPGPFTDYGLPATSVQHAIDNAAAPALKGQLALNLGFGGLSQEGLLALGFAPGVFGSGLFPSFADFSAMQSSHPWYHVKPSTPVGGYFMATAEQALFTLANSPATRVAGIEIGGWDTHSNQDGTHTELLRWLGWGLRDLYDAIQAMPVDPKITIVVVTEFGRTNFENGSNGTDHGGGGLAMVIGNHVNGGTYNCRDGNQGTKEFGELWPALNPPQWTSPYEDAVPIETEFRDFIAELAHKVLGVPLTELWKVIPGYPANAQGFTDFLS